MLTRDDRVVDHLGCWRRRRWARVVRQLVPRTSRSWLALLHAGVSLPRSCLPQRRQRRRQELAARGTLLQVSFVADDIVLLEERSGLVSPVRLAISIKNGSWPVVGSLFPELADAPIIHFGGRTSALLAEQPCRPRRFGRVPCRRRVVPALRQGRARRADPLDPRSIAGTARRGRQHPASERLRLVPRGGVGSPRTGSLTAD